MSVAIAETQTTEEPTIMMQSCPRCLGHDVAIVVPTRFKKTKYRCNGCGCDYTSFRYTDEKDRIATLLAEYSEPGHQMTWAQVCELLPHSFWGHRGFAYANILKNEYHTMVDDRFRSWDACIESGKGYLVGSDVPTKDFLRSHTSRLCPWQKLAYLWAKQHPAEKMILDGKRYSWSIQARGEYVDFSLPHHDKGGEKGWISCDGRTRVLVNVD
jgi:hypothetical protein